MITSEMMRKLDHRAFDKPSVRCDRLHLVIDIEHVYELAEEGYGSDIIAKRVGLSQASVKKRLNAQKHGKKSLK